MNKSKTIKELDKISFSFVLSSIGNLIGFYNGSSHTLSGKIDIFWSEYIIFDFINNGGLTSFDPSLFKLSSEFLFLLAVIKSINNKNYLETLKTNFIDTYKFIEKDENERNLDIITKASILKIMKNQEISYDENADSSFAIIRSIPFGLLFKDTNKLIEYSIETTKLTHHNGPTIIGSICCALITKMALNKEPIKKWIEKAIEELEKIDFKSYKYGKLYNESKEIYLDKLKLYLERSTNKMKALIYPSIRSEYYHRNFNQGKFVYYGNKSDDAIIIAYDCLMDCIINEKPSFEKLIYTSSLNLGEGSVLGLLSCLWYGLYFGYTDDIPSNIFFNIENMSDILNIGNIIK
jgi:hypothetical protein